MRNNSIKKTLKYAYYTLCAIMFGALAVLEYLSHYRAGVMRHLYIKKMNYLAVVYTPRNIVIHLGIIAVIGIALFLICKVKHIKFYAIKYMVYLMVLIIVFYARTFKDMYTYAHIVMLVEFMFLVLIMEKTTEIITNKKTISTR